MVRAKDEGTPDAMTLFCRELRRFPRFSPEVQRRHFIRLASLRRRRRPALLALPDGLAIVEEIAKGRAATAPGLALAELRVAMEHLREQGALLPRLPRPARAAHRRELVQARRAVLAKLEGVGLDAAAEAEACERAAEVSLRWNPEASTITILARLEDLGRRIAALKNELVVHNMGLAFAAARRYMHGMRITSMTLGDLAQEGVFGLLRAVDRYDVRRGLAFSTMATWWVRKAVREAITEQDRMIRVPRREVWSGQTLRRAIDELERRLGRVPSTEEVAELTGRAPGAVARVLARERIEPRALEVVVDDDGRERQRDVTDGRPESSPFEQTLGKSREEVVDRLVAALPERQQTIVRRRFGLDQEGERTLEEIGRSFGLTRERIRQLEAGAMKRLRQCSKRALAGFL